MGIWSTLRDALGLAKPLVVRPLAPPTLTDAATARLAGLPPGHGIALKLVGVPRGFEVQVLELPLKADSHPGFADAPAPVVCDDATYDRLHGLQLDHHAGGWRVRTSVEVRAHETPNPDGRLYLTDRPLADGRAFYDGDTPGLVPAVARRLLARDDLRTVLLRDHTLSVERVPDAPWPPIDEAVGSAIREHFLFCGGTIPTADAVHHDDPLFAAVQEVLDVQVRPAIHQDGGDIQLISVADGVARVDLVGACRSCPASMLTLKGGVEKTLKEAFPGEIDRVEAV